MEKAVSYISCSFLGHMKCRGLNAVLSAFYFFKYCYQYNTIAANSVSGNLTLTRILFLIFLFSVSCRLY